jgi:DtxR family Mn-dependent transcriptional regulator
MASSLDDRVVQRMYDMAGSPTESPHGAPIPTLEGVIPTFDDVPLAHVEPHHNYELRRVLTHEPDRLEYLAALGLKPGVILKLLHIAPFNGPIQLQLGREYRIIGHTLAEHLRVRQAD